MFRSILSIIVLSLTLVSQAMEKETDGKKLIIFSIDAAGDKPKFQPLLENLRSRGYRAQIRVRGENIPSNSFVINTKIPTARVSDKPFPETNPPARLKMNIFFEGDMGELQIQGAMKASQADIFCKYSMNIRTGEAAIVNAKECADEIIDKLGLDTTETQVSETGLNSRVQALEKEVANLKAEIAQLRQLIISSKK